MFIDQKILSIYQGLTEYLQVQTGKNCYHWAYVLTHISGILIMAIIALDFTQSEQTLEAGISVAGDNIFLIIIATIELFNLNKFKFLSQQDKPQPNLALNSFSFMRVIRVVFVLAPVFEFFIGNYMHGSLVFIWGSIHYLESCVPLPPSEVEKRLAQRSKYAKA